MTEDAIKELCFQKIYTENGFYYYSFSVASIDFISVGNYQTGENEWYVDLILSNTQNPIVRLYTSSDVQDLVKILSNNII